MNLKINHENILIIEEMNENTIIKSSLGKNGKRRNEEFIDIMEKLSNIMMKHGEVFRARAYQKAQETVMSYPEDIINPEDLKGKPGIGDTIMEKLKEYVSTGTLKLIEREKNNPVNILGEVYGIGPKKAQELVEAGITSISELRENQDKLNDVQKVGLKYYEDILKRIPRSEIQQYKMIFETIFNKITAHNNTNNNNKNNSAFEIVGSYRRGAESSGDIDMIITSNSSSIFVDFIDTLISQKVIVHVLSRGQTKCLVVAKIPSSSVYRRVDFLYTSQEEYPFAVLYFTGSKIFNTVMRQRALEMGFTMNEHGLYTIKDKKKGEKVVYKFYSEKDIFDYLNMEYKNPQERMDGRAVIMKKANNTNNNTNSNNVNIIKEFQKNGITVLQKLNESQISNILREANKAYYNKEQPLMTDNEYDIIRDFMKQKNPTNVVLNEVGAVPSERNKVALPYYMGSMDKIKPDTNALISWSKKFNGPYILSCKLDGVSGLFTTEGAVPKLYTRGDGKVGQDISHLIPYLRLPKIKDIVIRGEFIIPKLVFETKYKGQFANPRNMVSGIINQKTVNDTIKDVHFVAYELIKPIKAPLEQLSLLSKMDVEVVLCRKETYLTNELLSSILIDWREKYNYEIDGIIVTDNKLHERSVGNPEYAFAFKMVLSDQIAEAKVIDVIWTASKDGYLKPRVQIEPIHLGGVKIEYATGFNGSFVHENKVGVGAIIELIRSGDVIPHIRKIVVPAEQAKMPSVPYKWNDTHIDVLLENIDSDETVKEKNITGFFKGIGVDGLSSGNVARIMKAGFDSVLKIIRMNVNDFLTVDGFKITTATKLYQGIREKLCVASLVTIMAASNLFGRGFSEKKLEIIMENYPDVLVSKESISIKVNKVSSIKGMATKTAEAFVERIHDFVVFAKEIGVIDKLFGTSNVTDGTKCNNSKPSHPLFGKTIVITGFRDKGVEEKIKGMGAKLGSSVSKNTFVVLAKDPEMGSGKVLDAQKLGIPIIDMNEFHAKYL